MTAPKMEARDFEASVAPHRAELHAYCYRMLGSLQDADDAVQDALLGAWRGFSGFQGRSTLRSWLFQISTNACLRLLAQRPKRILAPDYSTAARGVDIDAVVVDSIWLEPYPPDPAATFERLESVELAFVAALQNLPANQRAVLILRDVLGFGADEVAIFLDTTVASVTSALQRARSTVALGAPAKTQQATLRELGDDASRALAMSFANAWERSDVDALVKLLADDAKFTMPPIPTWFLGRNAIARFFSERIFATPWRLVPMHASGQLAFACYQGPEFRVGALNVLTLRDGLISETTGFLDPKVHARFLSPDRLVLKTD